jgi:hypothetical protein
VDFTAFVLSHLPPPPARVLEVGCGREGGVTPVLAEHGYDVLGIDPRAPEGPLFRSIALEELEEPLEFDAVVASRVLHHVSPLEPAVEKLARLAPLLLLDEFAHERLDAAARDWYGSQFRILVATGQEPPGPPDLVRWREDHQGLHPSGTLLEALGAHFETRHLEWRPYLYRWLGGVSTETLEGGLVAAGAIPALGFRYAGVATSGTARSDAAAR